MTGPDLPEDATPEAAGPSPDASTGPAADRDGKADAVADAAQDPENLLDADDGLDAEGLLERYLNTAFALPEDVAGWADHHASALTDEHDDLDQIPGPLAAMGGPGTGTPLRPLNLNLLTSVEADLYWRELDAWVSWLRREFGLGVTTIPPLWHRHPELRWELSALHTAFLASYDPEASAHSPITWHRELAEARNRLADWVARSGTGLTEDRTTQITLWPGEPGFGDQSSWSAQSTRPRQITDRAADFEAWLADDIAQRRRMEDAVRNELHTTGRSVPDPPTAER